MVPYDLACPRCNAPPGYACVNRKGLVRHIPHSVRQLRENARDREYPSLDERAGKWVRTQLSRRDGTAPVLVDLAERFLRLRMRLKQTTGTTPDIFRFASSADLYAFLAEHGVAPEAQNGPREALVIYQSPRWLVVLPYSMAASIFYGDGTQWCTARKEGEGENLFYGYVALQSVRLFYLRRLLPSGELLPLLPRAPGGTQSADDALSVGFYGDQMLFDAERGIGGVTVNAWNENLTDARLRQILGSEYVAIRNAMTANTQHSPVSPAEAYLDEMIHSAPRLHAYLRQLSRPHRLGFLKMLSRRLGDDDPNWAVTVPFWVDAFLDTEVGHDARAAVAYAPAAALDAVFSRPLPGEVLREFAEAVDTAWTAERVYYAAVAVDDLPALVILAKSPYLDYAHRCQLANLRIPALWHALAESRSLPPDLAQWLARYGDTETRLLLVDWATGRNWDGDYGIVTEEVLLELAQAPEARVRDRLGRYPYSLPSAVRARLMQPGNITGTIRARIARQAPVSYPYADEDEA